MIPAAAPPGPGPAAPAPPAGDGGASAEPDPAEVAIDQAYEGALSPPALPAPEVSEPQAQFTINRQAGVVSVFASQRQHDLVAAYLAELHASISRQVLVEAKIFEVALQRRVPLGDQLARGARQLQLCRPARHHRGAAALRYAASTPRPTWSRSLSTPAIST